MDTEAQREEPSWPSPEPRAGPAWSRGVTSKGPAGEDPQARAGPRSSACAAAQNTGRGRPQFYILVTHHSGEIKLRYWTTTEKVARKC